MSLNHVTLDDKYDLTKSRVFVTGYQALVRLTLMQKELDRRAGLNTAGYVTGYRGSPLGGLDYQFQRVAALLQKNDVVFQPGINEDLAATALWGTQQAELRGEGKYDGVFGIWYGKGPGVDRTGDVFRHANFAGTSKHGGVLALMGDDHTAESSTTAHQSEYHFVDVMIPILNPAGVQEILDYGLYGFAMSRFCGAWAALKCMHETVESTGVIDGSLERIKIVTPTDFRDARGRAGHPAGRHVPRHGGAPPRLQARRHARLHPRQQAQPDHHLGRPQRQDRRHHHRQGLSRRAPGARRARHRRGALQRPWTAHLQGRLPVADQQAGPRGICAGPRPHHRRRGEALADRGPGARGALRHRQPADRRRQEGRAGQLAVPGQGRARSERSRDLHRRTTAQGRAQRTDRRPRCAPEGSAARARGDAGCRGAHAVFLLRLPAQFIDRGAGRLARLRRHRLPLHGAMDGPLDSRLHPHGRRGRQLDRRGAVLDAPARVPEPRRRHLQPFRLHGDPRRNRVGRQHHLQDPVQRCGRHDRRPDARRRPHRAADRGTGGGRGRQARRRGQRRAEEIPAGHRMAEGRQPSITATICRRCRRC